MSNENKYSNDSEKTECEETRVGHPTVKANSPCGENNDSKGSPNDSPESGGENKGSHPTVGRARPSTAPEPDERRQKN